MPKKIQTAPTFSPPPLVVNPVRVEPSEERSFKWLVSPALAKLWLETRAPNRKITSGDMRIPLYSSLMKSGDWGLGEAILFNPEGQMIDGQHRMMALVAAGFPIKFWITMGVKPGMMAFLNSGKSRTLHQSMTIAGTETSAFEIAMVKALFNPVGEAWGVRATRLLTTNPQLITDAFKEHQTAIRFVSKFYGKNKALMCKYAPIRSAAIRAYYHIDKEDLAKFLCILDGGVPNKDVRDEIPFALRNLYLSKRGREEATLHSKATYALLMYSLNKPTKLLRTITNQPFPVDSFDSHRE